MVCTREIIVFLQSKFELVEVVISKEMEVAAACSIRKPVTNGMTFFNNKRWFNSTIETDLLSLLIAPIELDPVLKGEIARSCERSSTCLVQMAHPRSGFISVVSTFFTRRRDPGIHPSAIIDTTAKIAPTAFIGAGAFIGPEVVIGPNTIISEHVVINASTKIGSNCFIAPGAKIGQPGFGYERQANGEMMHFPHLGSVVIGDNVDIGANTCIDRGTIDDTVIHDGVKIDNLCHISHNVEIGNDAVVIANSMIGGSVQIGPRAWIAPSASIINGVAVGSDATVGMGSTVVKPIPAGLTVAGSPAAELSEFVKQRQLLKKFVELFGKE